MRLVGWFCLDGAVTRCVPKGAMVAERSMLAPPLAVREAGAVRPYAFARSRQSALLLMA
jgi:hypothetical protein